MAGTCPNGYLEANGAYLLRADYAHLFSAISTNHGTANANSFNIPDYRGTFLRGYSDSSINDPDKSSRTAMATVGAVGNYLGSIQADEFKSHTHIQKSHSHHEAEGYSGGGA